MELSDTVEGKLFTVLKHRLYIPTLGERVWNYKTHLANKHGQIVSASPDTRDPEEFLSFFETYVNSNYLVINDPNNPIESGLIYKIKCTVDSDLFPSQERYQRRVAETDCFDLRAFNSRLRQDCPTFRR